jgi:hypothetical protein
MNCKDFESMIHEVVSRRVADKTKQLEALEHAGHCLWCALRLDEETKLTQRLQAFAGTLQAQRAPVRVEEELLQAFRERTLRTSAPRFRLAGKRLWRGLSWALAFAATVATAWIVILQWPRLHPRSTNPKLQASVLDHHQEHSGGQVAPHGRPESAALDESASEVTTDFISLGTCDDSQCMDEATLVRVTLPAEALLAFGLGTDNDYAPEGLVQADVALASDGVPFAIRFVD